MTELEGLATTEVARRLNISVANVYVHRQRVSDMIKKIGQQVQRDMT